MGKQVSMETEIVCLLLFLRTARAHTAVSDNINNDIKIGRSEEAVHHISLSPFLRRRQIISLGRIIT